jgi:hypothetical protein
MMKMFRRINILILFILTLSSCTANDRPLELGTGPSGETYELPYYADLSVNKRLEASYTPYPFYTWYVKETTKDTYEYNRNSVPAGTPVLLLDYSDGDYPPDSSPVLKIGCESWTDYTFSFDFYLGGEAGETRFAGFSAYTASGQCEIISNGEVIRSADMPFWFTLSRENGLMYHQASEQSIRYMDLNNGAVILPGRDVWHHTVLELRDLSLHLIFDGEDRGEIVRYKEKPYGGIALYGSNKITYKNISIVPCDEN